MRPSRGEGKGPSAESRASELDLRETLDPEANKPQVLSIVGTRPEVIKMAPVARALGSVGLEHRLCLSGQHREMVRPFLQLFGLEPAHDLGVMKPEQTLPELTSRLLTGLSAVIEAERPAAVLVQGDTATTLAGALAAFYARVPVGHVEAGLRSGRLDQPFPEEGSRRIVDVLATWSFAPTERCRQALLREGRDPESIFVTGNTVVDALQEVRSRLGDWPIENHRDCLGTAWQAVVENDGPLLFVTVHRRESFGPGIEAVCAAIERLAEERAELRVVFPVHLNPAVQGPIHRRLGGLPNVHLLEPVPYDLCLRLMARATLILSDSGGIQEEAPSLGTPLLVAREVSERGEGLDAGVAHLVGTDPERIVREATRLLDDAAARQAMIGRPNPYGDGHAASRIAAVLAKALGAFPEAGDALS